MSERVGRVYYEVDAENNVSKGLAAAQGEAQAFTQAINAMEAKIEVEGDISDLMDDLATVKAMKEGMEKEKIEVGFKMKDAERALKNLEKGSKEWKSMNMTAMNYRRQWEKIGRAIDHASASQKGYNSFLTSRKRELDHLTRVTKAEEKHAKAIDGTTAAARDQEYQIAKLEDRYVKLHAARLKADKGVKGVHSRADKARLNLIEKEMALARERLISLGRTKNDVDSLDASLNRSSRGFSRWFQSISQARIHLGFFSTTLAGLSRIMVILGPVIMGVLGALGSLISVAGSGLAGALAVGGAAFTGLGLAAVGAGFALREPIHQLGVAWKASTAYGDAVQKYGKNSSQAQDKQEQLNNAIKGLPPEARKAVQTLGGMQEQFQKLGGDRIRGDFFGSFAQGIKTAKALLPAFAKGSADVFHAASEGFNDWMRGMRTSEAQNILKDIFKGTADFLPGLMAGLGNLGATFGRISQSASKLLGGLGQGFEQWTQGIEDSIGSGDQLDERVKGWVESMRKVGHFAQAGTKALMTFFGIGVGPGGQFLDGMTKSLNRWNNEMKRDPTAIRNFFQRGVEMAEQLGPAIGRTLGILAKASVALEPFLTAAAGMLNLLLDVASKIPAPVLAAAGAFAVLSKAIAALTGIRLGGALMGLLMGGRAGAIAGGGGLLTRLFGRGGATAASTGIRGFAASLGTTLPMLGVWGAVAAAAGVGGYFLVKALSGLKSPTEQATEDFNAFNQANRAIPQTMTRNANAQNQAGAAWARYSKLAKQGKGTTEQATQSLHDHAVAQEKAIQAQKDHQFEVQKQGDAMQDLAGDYQEAQRKEESMSKAYGKGSVQQKQAAEDAAAIGAQLRLATLNYNRLQHGAEAATPAMLKSLQGIKNLAGRQTALKFRFDDQAITGGVNRLSQKLSGLGQKSRVIKILANSKNAEQAYARLIKLDHQTKNKKINISANDQASGKVSAIQGKIANLKDKVVQMKANDAASSKIAAIQAQIAALHDKVVTITTYYQTRGNPSYGRDIGGSHFMGGVRPPGYAAGGVPMDSQATWLRRVMDRAYARADQQAGLRADRGQKITSPRYIVGEETPQYNEFIITENPAYRQSNLRYLQMAAQSMGRQLVPGFGGGGKKKGKKLSPMQKATKGAKAGNKRKPGLQSDAKKYSALSDEVDYWADELDLDRRAYDSNLAQAGTESYARPNVPGGGLLAEMLGDIDKQIFAYQAMIPLNASINKQGPITVPKGHFKKDKKQKKFDKKVARIEEYNDALDEAKGVQMSDRDIQHAIAALNQEAQSMVDAANTNTLLGQVTADTLRWQVAQQYGSNVIATAPSVGATGLASSVSPGLATASSSAAGASASTTAATVPAATNVSVTNNFTEPPSDPLTWSQGVVFELGAAVA